MNQFASMGVCRCTPRVDEVGRFLHPNIDMTRKCVKYYLYGCVWLMKKVY